MQHQVARPIFVVDDPLFDEHRARGYHPERPERLLAARHALTALSGASTQPLAPRDATATELGLVHHAPYIEELDRLSGLFGALDDDTYLGPRSVAAAYRAAGGALALSDALSGATDARLGVALVRPPGHHARPDGGMGFCLLNNVALAAANALARGVSRVAIVDWDVHHGNGTQEAFYADPRVLFVSLHQAPFYPGTGGTADLGAGDGKGFNVNVPLSPNAGDATYRAVFDRIVTPVLDAYAPELIFVSAGFDAHARDPLAGMVLSADGFRHLAASVRGVAERHAKGRVGVFLEGGYDLEGLESSLGATLSALTGLAVKSPPDAGTDADAPPLSTRHGHDIHRAEKALAPYWKL
jgi:acetoin utilization deacetylase AcuC-like enzyme